MAMGGAEPSRGRRHSNKPPKCSSLKFMLRLQTDSQDQPSQHAFLGSLLCRGRVDGTEQGSSRPTIRLLGESASSAYYCQETRSEKVNICDWKVTVEGYTDPKIVKDGSKLIPRLKI